MRFCYVSNFIEQHLLYAREIIDRPPPRWIEGEGVVTHHICGVDLTFTARVQSLRDRYPYQFARIFTYGLSIETGWIGIIESVCEQIDLALEEANARKECFSWLQVKEKLGGLRMAWGRGWDVPEAPLPLAAEYLPEFVYPEAIPEDPEADPALSLEEYVASPRFAEWEAMHRIPNSALANLTREPRRYFERLMSVEFEEGVSEAERDLVTLAIAKGVMVPEDVTHRIREIIDAAEEAASKTCQFCGAPGNRKQLDGDGWIVVGCARHGTRKAIADFNRRLESERKSDD